MFEVIVTARLPNPGLITGWQCVATLVLYTSPNRLTAERLVEQPAVLLSEYTTASRFLREMYPGASVGMEVRKVV